MAETTTASHARSRQLIPTLGSLATWATLAALGALLLAQLAFFATHAAHMLGYPYPLDYGEGPLLAQVNLLLGGTPIWRLYADPGLTPYAVVNYPPVYHLTATGLAWLIGNTLLAGRLVSLASTFGALAALWILTTDQRVKSGERRQKDQRPTTKERGGALRPSSFVFRLLVVLAFLALPIVREWAVVMRVDMLGVCLGLWGLVLVQRNAGRRAVLWAALPLALSLLVKPSLIAAPAAALVWLLFRDWRRAVGLALLMAALGGAVVGLLELGSGGWFTLHVLAANANEWQRDLAYGFWHDQMVILWPLVAAAAVGAVGQVLGSYSSPKTEDQRQEAGDASVGWSPVAWVLLPLYYTLFGAIGAYGVGKVGAYTNYFLEFYAGLIWLAAAASGRWTMDNGRVMFRLSSIVYRLSSFVPSLVALLVLGALLRYYPTWSETYLKLAGIIEGKNPPRLVAGRYGPWRDLARESDILATMRGINAALDAQVRAAGAPIFTDVPGVAAQAGYLARLQAFEHRQLLDAGLWDQRPLLRDMANGRVPLVVLDYLGNWLTPEMIELIKHRYAQDGSRGTYDLYRPVDPGPVVAANLPFPDGLRLVGYHLARSPGGAAYHGGEPVLLTLDWQHSGAQPAGQPGDLEVVVQVTDGQGYVFLETSRPLLYGALPPEAWSGEVMQHLQPIALPAEVLPLDYHLAVTLRRSGADLAPPRALAPLPVEEQTGRQIGDAGYYLPAPFLAEWERLGGEAGPGQPISPAVPLPGAWLQCFARTCLRLEGATVRQEPLGELVQLADVGLRPVDATAPADRVSDVFRAFYEAQGGEATLGPAITHELVRGDTIVQYTRFARLERPLDTTAEAGDAQLANLGDEYMRLPGGVPYRWP